MGVLFLSDLRLKEGGKFNVDVWLLKLTAVSHMLDGSNDGLGKVDRLMQ